MEYFIKNRLSERGISVKEVFEAIFKMDPTYEYELKGAKEEDIELLKAISGMELPDNYLYFLQRAGEKLGRLKVKDKFYKDPMDFNIHTVIKKYEEFNYPNKEKKKLKNMQHLHIAYIGLGRGIGYEDLSNMLTLNCKSGELFDLGEVGFIAPSLEEMLFHWGFLSLNCRNKIGHFSPTIFNPIKVKHVEDINKMINKEISAISTSVILHECSSITWQYFTIENENIHLIVEFLPQEIEYVNLNISLYQTINAQLSDNKIKDIIGYIENINFIKELGLKYQHHHRNKVI